MRVPRPDELGALLFEYRRQRSSPRTDHELAQVLAYEVPEPEGELVLGLLASKLAEGGAELGTSGFRGACVPGSLLHGGLSGLSPENPLGVGLTATSNFNRDRDYVTPSP